MSEQTTYTPSLGARMWVQVAKDFGRVINLLPEDDRDDAMALIPILWSDDPDEVAAAEHTLYEMIDDPPGHLMDWTLETGE